MQPTAVVTQQKNESQLPMAEEDVLLPAEQSGARGDPNADDTSPGRTPTCSRSRGNASRSGLSQLSRKAIAGKVLKRNLTEFSQQCPEKRKVISERFTRNGNLVGRRQNSRIKLQPFMTDRPGRQSYAENDTNRRSVTISELRGFLNQNRNRREFNVQIGHPENGYPNIQLTVTPRANEKPQKSAKFHSRRQFEELRMKLDKNRQKPHSAATIGLPTLTKQHGQMTPSIAITASTVVGGCNNNHRLSSQGVEGSDEEKRLNSSQRLRAPVVVRNHQIVSSGRSRSGKLVADKLRLLSAKKLSCKELIDRWLEDSFNELRV